MLVPVSLRPPAVTLDKIFFEYLAMAKQAKETNTEIPFLDRIGRF